MVHLKINVITREEILYTVHDTNVRIPQARIELLSCCPHPTLHVECGHILWNSWDSYCFLIAQPGHILKRASSCSKEEHNFSTLAKPRGEAMWGQERKWYNPTQPCQRESLYSEEIWHGRVPVLVPSQLALWVKISALLPETINFIWIPLRPARSPEGGDLRFELCHCEELKNMHIWNLCIAF